MDTWGWVIAVAVVLVVLVATLLVRFKGGGADAAPTQLGKRQAPGSGASATDDDSQAVDTELPRVATVDLPDQPGIPPADLATIERPTPTAGRMARLRSRLAGSGALGQGLLALLSRDTIDEQTWDEIEETLIGADLGVAVASQVVDHLRDRVRVDATSDPEALRVLLRQELLAQIDPGLDRSLHVDDVGVRPAVVLVVGVNGTGKTTTTGKLARVFVAEDRDVVLGAADTFRAAAAQQLQTWGDRVGVPVVRGPEGGDPASVAFDAVKAGIETEADVVIVDTAGRLHTKAGLMDELGKVKRVIEKQSPVDEVLLVLD
ncbi:MAG TPA: signal recognition particle receptor subunit alpha, partial [Actinomycetes bacterium]|nr:signal recognition particle receptor subunit alpha [Actinomycetes bacterium]